MRRSGWCFALLSCASVAVLAEELPKGVGAEVVVGAKAAAAPHAGLKLGVVAVLGRDAAAKDGRALAAWLAARTGKRVSAEVFSDYDAAADALVDGRVDVAWLPPLQAFNVQLGGARSLAKVLRGGKDHYYSALFVAASSPVKSPTELSAARAAWVDRNSATGHVFAVAALAKAGVKAERALASQKYLGSHAAVCKAVLEGRADVGATFSDEPAAGGAHALDGCIQALSARKAAGLRIIGTPSRVPSDVFFARKELTASDATSLQAAVLALPGSREGQRLLSGVLHADGVAPFQADDLLPVQRALEASSGWPEP